MLPVYGKTNVMNADNSPVNGAEAGIKVIVSSGPGSAGPPRLVKMGVAVIMVAVLSPKYDLPVNGADTEAVTGPEGEAVKRPLDGTSTSRVPAVPPGVG